MKISTRLLAGFILVAVLAIFVGAIGIINIGVIESRDTVLYEKMTKPISEVVTATDSFHRMRVIIRDALITTDKELGKKELAKIEVRKAELNKVNENIKDVWQSQESKVAYNDYATKLQILYDLLPSLIQTIDSGDGAAAAIMLQDDQPVGKAFSDTQDALSNIAKLEVDNARIQAEENTKTANTAATTMLIIIVICVLLAVALGLLISNSISKPIKKLAAAADKLALGNVSVEINATTKDEIGKLNQSFSNMIDNIRGQALNAQRIAEGNLDFEIIEKSKQDVLAISMKQVVSALRELVVDMNTMSIETSEGKLIKADATKHNGEYRKIVEGVNGTLDAIITPLNEATMVLNQVELYDFTSSVTGKYKGTFKLFTDSINDVSLRLQSVQDAFIRVSNGDTTRLAEFKKLGKRSENDKLTPAATSMMQAIEDIINEVEILSDAAINGELHIRGDVQKFNGGYQNIISGMNNTMEAVVGPIIESSAVLHEIVKGNLTVKMEGEYKGDYAKIKDSLNATIDSFNEVLNDINDAASQVASGSKQVSNMAQALSQGTTEQASSVEELTSSMDEIAAKTKQNAINANQANVFTLEAKAAAVNGNIQMIDMLTSMEQINESSINISRIIKVIDEIAFQTNILALNAAVEAARAGQQGRGFAVVAEEVRNLAARSATAAKETSELIEGSVRKVKDGTKLANETASALSKIVDGVSQAATLVGDIAIASNEQATGIAQVNRGIMQVAEVIQTNSATSEESAAASEELSSQAELLNDKIGQFKLKEVVATDYYIKNSKDIRMLEDSSNNNKPLIKSKKIVLDSKEFGKY